MNCSPFGLFAVTLMWNRRRGRDRFGNLPARDSMADRCWVDKADAARLGSVDGFWCFHGPAVSYGNHRRSHRDPVVPGDPPPNDRHHYQPAAVGSAHHQPKSALRSSHRESQVSAKRVCCDSARRARLPSAMATFRLGARAVASPPMMLGQHIPTVLSSGPRA